MATISTHLGSSFSQRHNVRDRSLTDNEPHINPNGEYEIWKHEELEEAYERIFGEAVKSYNEKQTRNDRKIENYLDKVNDDKKLNAGYELIIGVYGKEADKEDKKEILLKFVEGWEERNPNLELIGAYFHNDEQGDDPHVHLDFVPKAEGYTRGMSMRPGLDKALRQQGFDLEVTMRTNSKGKGVVANTPQQAWEKRENEALESLCREYGIEVEHPQAQTDIEHKWTDKYKADKELEKTEEQVEEAKQTLKSWEDEITYAQIDLNSLENQKEEVKGDISTLEQKKSGLEQENASLDKDISHKSKRIEYMKKNIEEGKEYEHELRASIEDKKKEIKKHDSLIDKAKEKLEMLNECIRQTTHELFDRMRDLIKDKKPHQKVKVSVEDLQKLVEVGEAAEAVKDIKAIEKEREDIISEAKREADKMLEDAKWAYNKAYFEGITDQERFEQKREKERVMSEIREKAKEDPEFLEEHGIYFEHEL